MIVICGTHVWNDDISGGFIQILKIFISGCYIGEVNKQKPF